MPTCCVVDCENRTSSGVKFFRIPAGSHPFQKNRRHLWLQAVKRADWDNATIKEARVCSAHFISGEASLDSSSPDFVPSLFVYTKQSQTPKTKMERYYRKRRRDERPDMQPASSMAEMEQDCTIDHCSDEEEAEGDRPVSRKEYDDLCFRHQLQEDYINLQQDCYKLRSENEELKHELQKSKFSYSNVKSSIGQLLFFTGLTSVIFEWLLKKLGGSIEKSPSPSSRGPIVDGLDETKDRPQ